MNTKYEITDIAHEKYPFLHRIRALRDVGIEVRAGDLGGFVEGEFNLSQEQGDSSWIFDDAIAAGCASVDKDSCLRDKAVACEEAYVTQRSALSGHSIRLRYGPQHAQYRKIPEAQRTLHRLWHSGGGCAGYRDCNGPLGRKNPQQLKGYAGS